MIASATDAPDAPRDAEQRREDPALAVEHPRRLLAAVGGAAAELGQRERVERAGGDRAVDAQRVEPVDELARGAPGERDREHVAGLGESAPGPGTRCGA